MIISKQIDLLHSKVILILIVFVDIARIFLFSYTLKLITLYTHPHRYQIFSQKDTIHIWDYGSWNIEASNIKYKTYHPNIVILSTSNSYSTYYNAYCFDISHINVVAHQNMCPMGSLCMSYQWNMVSILDKICILHSACRILAYQGMNCISYSPNQNKVESNIQYICIHPKMNS